MKSSWMTASGIESSVGLLWKVPAVGFAELVVGTPQQEQTGSLCRRIDLRIEKAMQRSLSI